MRLVLRGRHTAVCGNFQEMLNLFLNWSHLDRPDAASVSVRFPTELMDRESASLTFS